MTSTTSIIYEIVDTRLHDFPLEKGTQGSAGYDLRACILETLILAPDQVVLIPTGIKLQMPSEYMAALLLPRSGLGHKQGLVLGNLVGVIDSDYTGEMKISAWNRSKMQVVIEPMDRIAQLLFVPIVQTQMFQGVVTDAATRGANGFSSTGVR